MPKKATALRVIDDDGDVRARILAAAVEATVEVGLAGLSMRDVARRARVSHQLPYHYFTDREGILAAIAEQGFTILGASLKKALDHEKGKAADRFAACGRAYVEFACENPAYFRVMFRADFVAIDHFKDARECADEAFSVLPMLVQEAIAEGFPAEPNPLSFVVLGWSIAHGFACLLLDGPLPRKLPEAETSRDTVVRDVMEAMKNLIQSRIDQANAAKTVSPSTKKKPRR